MKLFYCVIQIIQLDECLNDYFEIKISIKCQKKTYFIPKVLNFIFMKSSLDGIFSFFRAAYRV